MARLFDLLSWLAGSIGLAALVAAALLVPSSALYADGEVPPVINDCYPSGDPWAGTCTCPPPSRCIQGYNSWSCSSGMLQLDPGDWRCACFCS